MLANVDLSSRPYLQLIFISFHSWTLLFFGRGDVWGPVSPLPSPVSVLLSAP
jgi:hypothetical protein